MEFARLFGSLHPALVHFPIALVFMAFALDLWAWLRKDDRVAFAGFITLLAGTIGMMFAFIAGNFAEVWAARSHIPQAPIGLHANWANLVSWWFIGVTVMRSYWGVRNRKFPLYLVMCLAGLGMLTFTGYQGGQLVYKYAAGVVGVQPPFPATAQDLANLSLENTEIELAYSDIMHHIFGWLVLCLAAWLAYQYFELPGVERVRAAGPVVLLVGGVFLMVFSDWDAWPLGNKLPITDREVLAHKVIATLMILFGIGTSLARKRGGGEATKTQSHLVAVLALCGGGLLFTHVHTGAPFSNTAVGVYIQHFVIGCLALASGGIKMLELSRPEARRVSNLSWIGLLVLIAICLITYREGFPWYAPGPA